MNCRAGHGGATGYRRAGHVDVSSIVVLVTTLLLAPTVLVAVVLLVTAELITVVPLIPLCWSRLCY